MLFLGGVHIDRQLRLDGAWMPGASNPCRSAEWLGGAAFNTAMAASRLGLSCRLVASAGEDATSHRVQAEVARLGLAVDWITGRGPTGSYTVVVDQIGEVLFGLADLSAAEALEVGDVEPVLSASSRWFLVPNLRADVLAELGARRPAWLGAAAVSPAKSVRLRPILDRLDLLFCNRREAVALTGATGIDACLEALAASGCRSGVVTDGAMAVHWWDGGKRGVVVPSPLEVPIVSSNGAGDALAGATLAALERGETMDGAVRVGIAAARSILAVEAGWRADLSWAMLAPVGGGMEAGS